MFNLNVGLDVCTHVNRHSVLTKAVAIIAIFYCESVGIYPKTLFKYLVSYSLTYTV